jgi:hypothetical protein
MAVSITILGDKVVYCFPDRFNAFTSHSLRAIANGQLKVDAANPVAEYSSCDLLLMAHRLDETERKIQRAIMRRKEARY